jgi:hypothetical protein
MSDVNAIPSEREQFRVPKDRTRPSCQRPASTASSSRKSTHFSSFPATGVKRAEIQGPSHSAASGRSRFSARAAERRRRRRSLIRAAALPVAQPDAASTPGGEQDDVQRVPGRGHPAFPSARPPALPDLSLARAGNPGTGDRRPRGQRQISTTLDVYTDVLLSPNEVPEEALRAVLLVSPWCLG